MNSPTEFELKLSMEEVNIILKALGRLPFQEVFALIHKIHQQAGNQAGQGPTLTGSDTNEPT